MGKITWDATLDQRLKTLWPSSLSDNQLRLTFGSTIYQVKKRAAELGLSAERNPGMIPLRAGGPVALPGTEDSIDSHGRIFAEAGIEKSQGGCQFPIGEPGTPGYRLCGEGVERLCPKHYEKAHAKDESLPMFRGSAQLRIFGGNM